MPSHSSLNRAVAWLVVALAALLLAAAPALADTNARSGQTDWEGWSFDWQVSSYNDGISLSDVTYDGETILGRASMPVMRVYYDRQCGPYSDRLGGTLYDIPWAGNFEVAHRSFTKNGREWLELGIYDRIGSYKIYQAWYLSDDGILDAHIFSSGLQCQIDHRHYPYWRMDFDIDGAGGDSIQRKSGSSWTTQSSEFDASGATEYRVIDSSSSTTVSVLPGPEDWRIPAGFGSTESANQAANLSVFGRRVQSVPANQYTPMFNGGSGENGEHPRSLGGSLTNTDVVVVYRALMSHGASEGSTLWHSAGPRFIVSGAPATAPNAQASATPSSGSAPLSVAFSSAGSSDPQNDPLSYAWDFGDGATSTDANPVHLYQAAGSYTATLTVDDGNGGSDSVSVDIEATGPSQTVRLRNLSFNGYLRDDGNDASWTTSATGQDTTWELIDIGGGESRLRGVDGGGYLNATGSRVDVTSTAGAGADWRVSPVGGASTASVLQSVANNRWLDADSGGRVDTFTANNRDDRRWEIVPVGPPPPANQDPVADATVTPSTGAAPLTASFDASGSTDPDGDALSYSWDFGDGGSSTDVSPSHVYLTPGAYTATVTVSDGNGGSDTASVGVTVSTAPPPNRDPLADASASPTAGIAPLAVSFDASGSTDPDGDALSYSWDFGDGNSDTGVTPTHTYSTAGSYTASVTASDGNGGSDSASVQVTVSAAPQNQPPTAQASATVTSGDAPLQVGFRSAGSSDPDGDALTYLWEFGDGTSSPNANPGHTYQAAGTYTATLTVSDGNGGTDSASVEITVGSAPPPSNNLLLNGGFESGLDDWEDWGGADTTTNASAGSSAAEIGVAGIGQRLDATPGSTYTLTGQAWATGSGWHGVGIEFFDASGAQIGAEVAQIPAGSGYDAITHQGTAPAGSTQILVWFWKESGTLRVDELQLGDDSGGGANQPPTAQASATVTSGDAPLQVGFRSAGSSDPDGDALTYLWEFGDGTSSPNANPGHTYQAAGTYTATLTVSDGNGGTDSASVEITVGSAPPPSNNLLLNGGFESGLDDWEDWGGADTTTNASAGSSAAEIGVAGIGQRLDATPGSTYTLTGQAWATGSGWHGVGIEFFDASGAQIGAEVAQIPAGSGYDAITHQGTAPAGSTQILVWFWKESGTLRVDELQLGDGS